MLVLYRTLRGEGGKEWLIQGLEEATGGEVRRIAEADLDAGPADVVWIWGNPNWYPRAVRALTAMAPDRRPAVIIWHSEPLPYASTVELPRPRLHAREIAKIALRDSRATDPYTNARVLRRLVRQGLPDLLVVTSEAAREFLAESGIDCVVVPIGYHPRLGRDLGLERDIDTLFLGALDVPRRKRALRALRREGVNVHAVGAWDDPRYWDESRVRLLNRAKIVLSLARHPGQFTGKRLVLGMANRTLVVSEPIHRPEPFVPGEHFVSAGLEELPGVVSHYLHDQLELERVAGRGHDFVTKELTMSRSVSRILDALDRRLEARDG
jgi:hypothetical protein